MFERYNEPARRALFFARYEASMLGRGSIETEHVLLGLIREGKGIVARIFDRAGIRLDEIRSELEAKGRGTPPTSTAVEMPFSAETKNILTFAAEEADRLLHAHIGPEHLLLGIYREPSCGAATTLMQRGLQLNAVRESIVLLANDRTLDEDSRPTVGDRRAPLAFTGIRISPSKTDQFGNTSGPGFWTLKGCQLKSAILAAADTFSPARLDWPEVITESDRYDFYLTYEPDQPPAIRNQLMLKGIEKEFQLVIRSAERFVDVYVMTAPNGLDPALHKTEIPGSSHGDLWYAIKKAATRDARSITGLSVRNTTMGELGRMLEDGLDRPVVNETNVQGRYTFQVPAGAAPSPDRPLGGSWAEFLDALRDTAGLILTPDRRTVPILAVRLADS